MEEFDGLFDPQPVTKHGGAREGAGRKPKDLVREAELAAKAAGYLPFAEAKAHKETYLAKLAELQWQVKTGEKVDRTAVREAGAGAMAACAQSMRAIPDTIERKLGVAPEVSEEIGRLIDVALDELADELERMGRDGF
jgi:hypothetical protein